MSDPVLTPVCVSGKVAYLALPSGHVALVDADMADEASRYAWNLSPKDWGRNRPLDFPKTRAGERGARHTVRLNRLVMRAEPGTKVRSITRNKLDCRRSNLYVEDLRRFRALIADLGTMPLREVTRRMIAGHYAPPQKSY